MFIGMVVGAGFATGREIMLYFYGKSIGTVVFAGLLIGAAFGIFELVASTGIYQRLKTTLVGKFVSIATGSAVIMSFIVMTAGAEELLFDIFGVRFLGCITGTISGIIAMCGMKNVKGVNALLVPILVLIICVLTLGKGSDIVGELDILSSIKYVGLNMFMAGYFVLEEGERVSCRDILISSLLIGAIFSLMLIVMTRGIWRFHSASMPMYLLAKARGYKLLGGIMIFIAILSTLIGDAKLIFDNVYSLIHYRKLAVIFIIILSIISSRLDFLNLVNIVYGVEGVLGALFMLYITILGILGKKMLNSCWHINRADTYDFV